MAVMITGAAGFFGSALVRAFARAGEDVVAFDQTPAGQAQRRPDTPAGRVRYLTGDVSDRATLAPTRFEGITGIVHAAALSLPNEKEMDQRVVDVNLGGTTNLLHLATELPDCRKFLYVSSAGVYDQSRPITISESDATGGGSLYGATKLASEIMARRYGLMFGIDVGIIRPTSLWGPGELARATRPLVTPLCELVTYARSGQAIRIEHPESGCDWIYVDDGAEMAHAVYGSVMDGRAFTLSSGRTVPFSDVVRAVKDAFGLVVDSGSQMAVDAGRDRPAIFSNERLVSAVGYAPAHDLDSGMREFSDFLNAVMDRKAGTR